MSTTKLRTRRRVAVGADTGRQKRRRGLIVSTLAALLFVIILLCVGLTQFSIKSYAAQDGYVIPQNSLSPLLKSADESGEIPLLALEMGAPVYVRSLLSRDLYVGEDKVGVSAGYPMFTQSGQMLYFLDDSMKMVTEKWDVLTAYEGLYLSDGMTFNADRSQADIESVQLVQVDGGYQLARAAILSAARQTNHLPMNAACAFAPEQIVYYAYENGVLLGNKIDVPVDAQITLGAQTYDYLDFLERLGLWAEEAKTGKPTPQPEPEPEPELPAEEAPKKLAPPATTQLVPPPHKPAKAPSEAATPNGNSEPSSELELPGAALENPDAMPQKPTSPSSKPDQNPNYREPAVSFSSRLEEWVYTLSTEASVSDPSGVLRGGVQLYVYEVHGDGKESQSLRRAISSSGRVTLGQLRPNTTYHVVAEYDYLDKLNYLKSKTIELGSATTDAFDTLDAIALSFYDETSTPIGATAPDVFAECLQLRNLVLPTIDNGTTTEVGGITTHPETDPLVAETYINSFNLTATAQKGDATELQMDTAALRLLREGYSLSHWETAEKLRSGTDYTYQIRMQDRFGNTFTLRGATSGSGHTCKKEPAVSIRVPETSNVSGSTLIAVSWMNDDAVPVQPNAQEQAAMGNEMPAGLYLVEKGMPVIPANAIDLVAYLAGDADKKVVSQKFLPITINTDATVTNVQTQWVLTNLQVLKNYTAAVLCGSFEVLDGKTHVDQTLQEPTDFLTASLANLGGISYTAEVDTLTHMTGRLNFRMNSADPRLLALLEQVDFTVQKKDADAATAQHFTLLREALESASFQPQFDEKTKRYTASAKILLYQNGVDEAHTATIGFTGKLLPTLGEQPPQTVWEYLLATATTKASDECWMQLSLGSPVEVETGTLPQTLLRLQPKTAYVGRFQTQAKQGGILQDVTSAGSHPVHFATLSEEALVSFDNSFISTDFIELYGLAIADFDACILPDDADRGGNNVLIRIRNASGVQVSATYINATMAYDTLRLSGLETNKTYTMEFLAVKYVNGGSGAVELSRKLRYQTPKDEAEPYSYTFTTGESVIGSVSLGSISQLYAGVDGQPTDTLSMLSPDDFYFGVWQENYRLYYYDEADRDLYLQQTEEKEQTQELSLLARGEDDRVANSLLIKNIREYTANESSQKNFQDSWTTRFIAVQPGEQYSIYNTYAGGGFRATFYYRDQNGALRYSTVYTGDQYMEGGVFSVPTTLSSGILTADQICYMRISSLARGSSDAMVLQKYDAHRTENAVQLAKSDLKFVEGMNLHTNNSLLFNTAYAYTADYIPVIGGSIYELKGRDPNKPDELAQLGGNLSNSRVLFYGSDYTFLGSYLVSNQTALVKAPFGAAYCRMNLIMQQSGDGISLNTDHFSFKQYDRVIIDQYLVTLQTALSDLSEQQLLTGGSYTVTLYSTTNTVSDKDDLTTQDFVQLGQEQTYAVENGDFVDGKLSISRKLQFEKLNPNMGFKATLTIHPPTWSGNGVNLSTVYFTTNRVVRTVSNLAELKAIRNDPAGSYVVTADIDGLTGSILDSDRPLTGTIDFQGHSVSTSSFAQLIYRISGSGVVKNLVLDYDAFVADSTAAKGGVGGVAYMNYGTMQNIILHYNPDNRGYGIDMQNAGGLVRLNYGTIDGFVVELMKDVRVGEDFGAICANNYGVISNGYVCGARVLDENGTERTARLEHVWRDKNGTILSTNVSSVALGVGYHAASGKIAGVYVLGDLVVQSADARTDHSNADFTGTTAKKNEYYETSTTNTAGAGILVGNHNGITQGAFTVGDRRDFDPVNNRWSYMLDRGPAVSSVVGLYQADNLTYFSNALDTYSQESSSISSIGTYNSKGEFESLYDYQWYTDVLGADGKRFAIRDNVDAGYYPQLVLPACFPPDAQPRQALPALKGARVEVQSNEVRLQGTDAVLATITMKFPYAENAQITGFDVVARNNAAIGCEVLSQRAVEGAYRVDVLLTLPENGAALPDSSYTITRVRWTGGEQSFFGATGGRVIPAQFWREIATSADWKTYFSGSSQGIYGNYRLTADLDFSGSTTYLDWFVSQYFYGTLDGGIYSEKPMPLTDNAGKPILDAAGAPRTISVHNTLDGMHTISGVGNLNSSGDWVAGRDGTYRSSLMDMLVGKLQNLVFRNFVSGKNPTGLINRSVDSQRGGVVGNASAGAVFDNCHVRDSVFYSRGWIGALVGNGTSATVRNSSAKNVAINVFRLNSNTADLASAGGLIGYMANGLIENSFAAEVVVDAPNVYDAAGVGGLVGYAESVMIQDCYTTGTISAGASRVGGIAGAVAGVGTLSGCWSTAMVMTVADYAGGIVGSHTDGNLHNNYTASTVMTRSLAASSVHRICSTTSYDENRRRDNYAFQGQYLTYFDSNAGAQGESVYQFGVWEENDGATALLDEAALIQSGVWSNIIGVGASYDLTGSAVGGGISGGSQVRGVASGYMPKLTAAGTNRLLYDQPDVEIGYVTTSALGRVAVTQVADQETMTVTLAMFSDREGIHDDTQVPFDKVADWSQLSITGATVLNRDQTQGDTIAGVTDQKGYNNSSLDKRSGRAFSFTAAYGDRAGDGGHYLDSYILSLPIYDGKGGVEILQARISLADPVYKILYDVNDWNRFFGNPKYDAAYENVQIGWDSTPTAGILDFGQNGNAITNVKVNRLEGAMKPGTSGASAQYPVLRNLDKTFQSSGQSLIAQAVTRISNLTFEDMRLSSAWTAANGSKQRAGGNGKGVIGVQQGNMENVTFRNIEIDGGTGAYIGCIGRLYGVVDEVRMEDVSVTSQGTSVGALVGFADATSMVRNVSLTASAGRRNTVSSTTSNMVGGIIGRLMGIASDMTITNTDVSGHSFVGGAVGYAYADPARPQLFKVANVTVGDPTRTATTPGAPDDPDVTVTLQLGENITTTTAMTYAGGAVGHASAEPMEKLSVHNTKVSMPQKAQTDLLDNGNYSYYIGGVVGSGGNAMRESVARNCSVISYGGWAGGVSGESVGLYNTARDCVVYGISDKSKNLGGVNGVGHAYRSLAQHCVVSGGENVGGITGKGTSAINQSGAVDCIVLGRENVGGAIGWLSYHNSNYNHVTASKPENAVVTTVTADMLAPAQRVNAGTYSGTLIKGSTNTGGFCGQFTGVSIQSASVGDGVTVQGETDTGGLVGLYAGWTAGNWDTSTRSLTNSAMGAEVRGQTGVGGAIGRYTKSAGNTTISTALHPTPSNFHGLLITGNVSGSDAHPLMPGAPLDGSWFGYCRVYEAAQIGNQTAADLCASYDAVAAIPKPADRGAFSSLLTATAENLLDQNLYYLSQTTTYGGMGWSKSIWSGDALQMLYEKAAQPASTQNYQQGIVKDDHLVLWLDARNNTGEGYTDPTAATWKDLSKDGNNAQLYWNNKTTGASFTFGEKSGTYMQWRDGALEFPNGSKGYYAQLENSLSPYFEQGYTVEMIYTYNYPAYTGHTGILSWKDGAYYGGFHGAYNISYNNALIHYDNGLYTSLQEIAGQEVTAPLLRTATFVAQGAKSVGGKGIIDYYLNGERSATTSAGISAFRDTDTMQWRIGEGNYSQAFLRVCGVRVYDRALTPAELAQNAQYDSWYYFGGEKPATADTITPTLTLGEDGSVNGTYRLMRSEDGSYQGTLVNAAYQGGGLGSRGYYYLTDGLGNYSNVVCVLSPGYGLRLKTTDFGNEYYGATKYNYIPGQEGENVVSGDLHSDEDAQFYGGFTLPQAGLQRRDGTRQVMAAALDLLRQDLPEAVAYASGVDTVNLELRTDPPAGLTYAVMVDGETVLAGDWPEDSRTISMHWDYKTPFALELTHDTAQRQWQWGVDKLARTAMTHDTGYWYLYGAQCYDSAGTSLDPTRTFLHMIDGEVLDAQGTVWTVPSGETRAAEAPFVLTENKPVWAGTVANSPVESYGTYLRSSGGLKPTQLVVKAADAYTMPASQVGIGSFVVDNYGGKLFNTVLGSDGKLCDMGEPLAYPDDFSNRNIREISNTLSASGHVVLVRYHSGALVCFDYLSGEEIAVYSQENQDISLLDYLLGSLRTFGRAGALAGGEQLALSAADYQTEVLADPSLQAALANLKSNPDGTQAVDGEGAGLDIAGLPGGVDGVPLPGENADNGQSAVADPTQSVTAPVNPALPESGEAVDPIPENIDLPVPAETLPQGSADTPSQPPQVNTAYVAVYQPESGKNAVYDLEELLKVPEEQLVTQEERAKQLAQVGFQTSLLAGKAAPTPAASGLTLVILTGAGMVLLLICMVLLKKRKLDRKS